MEFFEFAQLLYPFIGCGSNKDRFVLDLSRNIMKSPVLSDEKELDENGKYYPLEQLQKDTLEKYYSKKPLSKRVASKILSNLDIEKFEAFIDNFPNDTLMRLGVALREKRIDVPADENVPKVCANLFVFILETYANKKRTPQISQSSNQLPEVCGTVISVEYEPQMQEQEMVDNKGTGLQVPKLSHPQYYLEYLNDTERLGTLGKYATWTPKSLDPELKEKWGEVRITDEFGKSIKDYEIAQFLEIAPLDLLPARKAGIKDDIVNRIRSAMRFVQHMQPAIDHMKISNENEEIFLNISNFIVLLKWYLDLLRENSNNLDLYGSEFILVISDDMDLKEKANKYYDELKSRLEDLEKRLDAVDEHRPNND